MKPTRPSTPSRAASARSSSSENCEPLVRYIGPPMMKRASTRRAASRNTSWPFHRAYVATIPTRVVPEGASGSPASRSSAAPSPGPGAKRSTSMPLGTTSQRKPGSQRRASSPTAREMQSAADADQAAPRRA